VSLSYTADTTPPELGGFITSARQDLAGRLDVNVDNVQVASVEEVVWSDSSYGCPAPGMAYIPGNEDGLRIVLAIGDEVHEYRLAGSLEPHYCDPSTGLVATSAAAAAKSETQPSPEAVDEPVDEPEPISEADEDEAPVESGDISVTPTPDKGTEPTEGLNPPDK
jgi:hypothetical protein